MNCGNTAGWIDGYFPVSIQADYNRETNGDVTITVSNTLDQGAGDESIGYGNMEFEYEFDDGSFAYPTRSPGDYDHGNDNPTGEWQNDCGAT
jgi:hypothetical protein